MFDPSAFGGGFLMSEGDCAFDGAFDASFDICSDAPGDTGGRGGGRRFPIRRLPIPVLPFEDPDELLALI